MATLIQLRNFANDSKLRNKIATSIALSVHTVLAGLDTGAPFSLVAGDHDKRHVWALNVLGKVAGEATSFSELVLSKNSALTATQIQNAIDDTAESNVDPIQGFVDQCVDLAAGVAV